MSTIIDSNTYDAPLAFQQPASIWPSALKWGAIGGAVSCVLTLVSYNIGWMDFGDDGQLPHPWLNTLLPVLIYIGLITLGLKAYRDSDNNGFLSFGRGVLWSLGFALAMGLISALFTILFYSVIAPGYLGEMIDMQIGMMEEQGMDDAQIEASESMLGMMMSPWVMGISALFMSVFFSLLAGLGVSAVLQRKPS